MQKRMSIYPVRLNEWYPVGDEMHEYAEMALHFRCSACGDMPNFKKAWGHHSVAWGYGEVWCNEKCLNSGKIRKRTDKRRQRSVNRRWGKRNCMITVNQQDIWDQNEKK